eukprot:TRINITY_DN746_c0_g1_i3.p1 TRINITY_DN746_c0_g1~~TRINITY_DN746_c0_g1_i3.p1  ORF type:complete len:522 (+),score=93.42 TRINITY_DN746_c0_g1_i3:1412-2977(+)
MYIDFHRQYQTLSRRFEDLNEQKIQNQQRLFKLQKEFGFDLQKMLDSTESSPRSDAETNEQTEKDEKDAPPDQNRQRSNSAVHMKKMLKNKLSAQEISENEQFISSTFLSLNEMLFRFIGIVAVIKSISLTSETVRSDITLIKGLFQNGLFDTLNEQMKFVILNKTSYANQAINNLGVSVANSINFSSNSNQLLKGLTREDTFSPQQNQNQAQNAVQSSPKNQTQSLALKDNNVSQKQIEIRKMFIELLPELQKKQQVFFQFLQQDFILSNFCTLEQFKEFFQYFKLALSNNQQLQSQPKNDIKMNLVNDLYVKFENDILEQLRVKGRNNFDNIFEALLQKIFTLLDMLCKNKCIIIQNLQQKAPDSPLLKNNQIIKKKGEKKKVKDWKTQVIKNKIEKYNEYQGKDKRTTEENENYQLQQSLHNDSQNISEIGNDVLVNNVNVKVATEDENTEFNYQDQLYQTEKNKILKQYKQINENQNKVETKPKVTSRYLEQTKSNEIYRFLEIFSQEQVKSLEYSL